MVDVSYIVHMRPILDKLRAYFIDYYSVLLGKIGYISGKMNDILIYMTY